MSTPLRARNQIWPVICGLFASACLLAACLKSPALLRYIEQRFHLSVVSGSSEGALAIEVFSQNIRLQALQGVQSMDRAAVFALQELSHGEISSQQALLSAQTQAFIAAQQKINHLSAGGAGIQKKGSKTSKTVTLDIPSQVSNIALAPLAAATPFKSDYAAKPLGLSAGDRVLLMGDSLMQGVAPHLVAALSKRLPGIFTLDISRQSTGLAYAGFFDWPATAAKTIAQQRINVLVVFIGANDFYDMPVNGKKATVGTPQWQQAYAAVVQGLIAQAHSQDVRVLWMEMPPMDKPLLREKVSTINAAFFSGVSSQKARWVPSLDLMSDEAGEYRKFLPNQRGGVTQMRLDDGVHFTVAGQKRLAARFLAQFELQS